VTLKVDSLPPDCRGEIHKLELAGAKVNLIYSDKGTLRGGDVHPNTQYGAILTGRVSIETPFCLRFYGPGDTILIPAGVPHLYHYHLPTVQLEWWSGEFSAFYHKPYRDQVEASMEGAKHERDK
jgi:hypothetical protein